MTITYCKVEILRVDGSRERPKIAKALLMNAIQRLIGARVCDVVNLRDGRVMLVDDLAAGYFLAGDGKPVNEAATKLYHKVCKPNVSWQIRGDVAIAWDKDFADAST